MEYCRKVQGAKAPGCDPRKRSLFSVLLSLFPPFIYLAIGMFQFNVLFCVEIQVSKKCEWKFSFKLVLLNSTPWGIFTAYTQYNSNAIGTIIKMCLSFMVGFFKLYWYGTPKSLYLNISIHTTSNNTSLSLFY